MALNGINPGTNVNITSASASYENVTFSAEITKTSAVAASTDAAVYEKSDEDKAAALANHKIDFETLDRLKADAEERTAQLRGLVEKLLLKQGGTFENAQGLANLYRKLEVDEETRAQAQEDISEDGYWGVEQTSDRIVSFAKALAGDNLELAQQMLEAVKEGFKQAGEEWGEDLPEISNKTMDATFKKLDEWIKSLGGGSDNDNASGSTAVAAAQTTTIKVSASYTRAEASYSSVEINK
ncbi:MAG: hypothetical protein IKX80_03395 [Lachnospiraceae bacterium]|nr:hypothetical protein [Lachnospiraceae bacterium]MBR5732468.1 hypothetical protein [Lachnospiraceae bacterium]